MSLDSSVDQPITTPTVNGTADTSINRMATGAWISLFGIGLGRGLELVKQIALARLLGPEAFGLYAIGWNLLRIVGILAPSGLQNGVVHFGMQYWRKDNPALRSILTRSVLLSFAIGWGITGVLLILAPWITAGLFKEPEFLPLFRIFALMLPFMGALSVTANATRITKRMIFAMASEQVGQGTLNLILFIALYLIGWHLLGAIVATVVSFAAAFSLSLYFLWRLFAPVFTEPSRSAISTRALLAYSLPTALASMFGVIINRVDRLFLGYYWPSEEVGVYQAAAQLSVILAMILNAFNMILMPMIAEQYHKRDMKQLEELYRVNTKWGIYCVVPVALVIFFAAGDVMTVLFGSQYTRGAAALLILTVGQFINIATGATGIILVMTGRQTAWLRLSMLIVVVNLTLNLALIPTWGMNGAAVATSLTVGGLFALGLIVVHHIHHIWPYDRRYLKGVIATIITAALLGGVRLLHLGSTLNLLMTTLVAAGSFYGLLLLLGLDAEDRTFIKSILRRVGKK